MPSYQRLLLSGTATQNVLARSNSSLSHSGTFDVTFKGRFVSQAAGAPELYECPNVYWCADSSLGYSVGYRLEMMSAGYQLFKNGTAITAEWGDGFVIGTTEITYRVREVAAGWELYKNGVLYTTFADTTRLTSGYFGFGALGCAVTFDEITGTFAQDFEGATLGAVTDNTTFATNMYSLGGGSISIESTGNHALSVTAAAISTQPKNIGLAYERLLSVTNAGVGVGVSNVDMSRLWNMLITPASIAATGNSVGLRMDRMLSVSPTAVQADGNGVDLLLNRLLTVTKADIQLLTMSTTMEFDEVSGGGMILFRQKGRR